MQARGLPVTGEKSTPSVVLGLMDTLLQAVIALVPVKGQFPNSIISATCITCHCSMKKISLPNFCLLFPIAKDTQILFLIQHVTMQ